MADTVFDGFKSLSMTLHLIMVCMAVKGSGTGTM